ncbi:hypothetical protein BC831DRAFT_479528 [Entophlyctis helioformis]|nr:hypothetical protein BC831DRAFT_479528 [Entophlyctis helioformis]
MSAAPVRSKPTPLMAGGLVGGGGMATGAGDKASPMRPGMQPNSHGLTSLSSRLPAHLPSVAANTITLSDAWRKSFVLTSKRRHERLLDTYTTSVPDTSKWSTCIAPIEGTNFLAIGSGAKTNNMFIVENTAVNKLAAPDYSYQPPPDSLVVRSAFSLPSNVFHLSSIGDKLVTAGPDGVAHVYKLEPGELGQKGKGLTHVHECMIGNSSTLTATSALSPPGVMIQTHRIKHVEFEPSQPAALPATAAGSTTGRAGAAPTGMRTADGVRRIAAVQSKHVYIYDLPTSQVVGTIQPSSDVLNRVTFSPHAPYGSLMATAGLDTHLYLMDSRLIRSTEASSPSAQSGASAIIWRASHAHDSPILDIKFNPFVPYWVATSGEDGVVKVWDIRHMGGPAARINGHYDAINAIAWSNTHCDIVASASSDRAWRAWSLQPDQLTAREPWKDMFIGCPGSEYAAPSDSVHDDNIAIGSKIVGEHQVDYSAPVVAMCASLSHADTFIGLSAAGEVMAHTIRRELFEQLAPHRYDDVSCRDIETKVYSRNLNEAYASLVRYTRTERPAGQMVSRHERELIDLVSLKPGIELPSDSPVVDSSRSDTAVVPDATAAGSAPPRSDSTSLGLDPIGWTDGSEKRKDQQDLIVAFRDDLEKHGYGLPPGFGKYPQWMDMIENWTQMQFNLVILRHQIVTDVLQGNWQIIVDKEKKLYTGMEADSEFLDKDMIQFFTEEVITHSYMKGLSMGLKFGEIVADDPKGHFEQLAEVTSLLLFPTVYDSVEWLPDLQTVYSRQPPTGRQTVLAEYVAKVRKLRAMMLEDANSTLSSPVSAQTLGRAPTGPESAGRTSTFSSGSGSGTRSSLTSSTASPLKRGDQPTKKSVKASVGLADAFAESLEKKRLAIAKITSESKEILPMISLEIRLMKLVEKQSDSIDEEIVTAMQQNVLTDSGLSGVRARGGTVSSSIGMAGGPMIAPFEKTISASANRMYLDALLATKRFDEFFGAGFDLIASAAGNDFSRIVFRLIEGEGMVRIKQHIDSLFTTATNHLQAIFQSPPTPGSPDAALASKGLVQGSKLARDAIIVLVKVAAHVMQGQELLRADKSQVDSLMKFMSHLTTIMLQLSSSLLKAFEYFDKALGKGNATTKEWAQTVHDSLRDAARTFPLSANKARPTQSSEKAATGHTIHEEIFSILDKLYRGFIKPDGGSAN